MEQLKETLLSFPHVQVVYLNKEWEWSFNEKTGFDIIKTRLEILETPKPRKGKEESKPED